MNTIEYAAKAGAALDGYHSLSRHTGLSVQEVAKLAVAGELRSLFDATTGRLRSPVEIRARLSGMGAQRGIDGHAAVAEMIRKRPTGDAARTALSDLRAKRRAWTNP